MSVITHAINKTSKEILLVVKKTHLKQFYSDYAEEQPGTREAPVNNTKHNQKEDRSKFSFRKEIEANVNCFYQKKPAANVTCLHQKKPEANVDCFHQYLLEWFTEAKERKKEIWISVKLTILGNARSWLLYPFGRYLWTW